MKELISNSLQEARFALEEFIKSSPEDQIALSAKLIANALLSGCKVISCGNGGSLCDAAHFAEELTGRYRHNRQPYAAIAINDPAYITCVSNDFCFEDIFSRYIEGVGKPGDVLLAISTSGSSENVIRAAKMAKSMGIKVIALTSIGDNPLLNLADITLASPKSKYSDRIQEIHIKIIHILIEGIERELTS